MSKKLPFNTVETEFLGIHETSMTKNKFLNCVIQTENALLKRNQKKKQICEIWWAHPRGEFIKRGRRKSSSRPSKEDCWWHTHAHMEQITWRLPIQNKVTQKKKTSLYSLEREKDSALLLAGLQREVMSSHPNLSASCCQGLGARAGYL